MKIKGKEIMKGEKYSFSDVVISEIVVNERSRKNVDIGKVKELSKSISEIGLINPITITTDKILIAGLHRLLAFKELGLKTIPSRMIDSSIGLKNIKLIELDENIVRSELHFIEMGEHLIEKKELYEEMYPETKEGQSQALGMHKKLGRDVKVDSTPTFVKSVSSLLGVSESTIKQDIQIAKNINPKIIDTIKEKEISKKATLLLSRETHEMQQRVVDKLIKEKKFNVKNVLYVIKRLDKSKHNTIELPRGIFNVIVADPPWKYDFSLTDNRKDERDYPTMELQEICDLDIHDIVHRDAVLFLWTTTTKILESLRVIGAWGFNFKTSMIWVKDKNDMGYYVRNQHELVLIATKGSIGTPLPKNRPSSVFKGSRLERNRKPEKFFELVEEMYPEHDYIELFTRKARDGWESWEMK